MRHHLSALVLLATGSFASAQLIPLTDLGSATYMGFQGGLYTGGVNTPPPALAAVAAGVAGHVVPLSPSGVPDPNGLIGVIGVGMSNTNQEFTVFERQEDVNLSRNARVVILNLAQGGVGADVMRNPAAPYWTNAAARIAASGLTAQQVQVVWLKQAQAAPPTTAFPAHAQNLQSDLAAIVRLLKDTYPNLRLAYLSSRIYGGYSANPMRNEPLSYETGFSVKWLIEQQQSGDPTLNWDPDIGPVEAPLILWGPYLWASGATPRSDGLTWLPGDYESDAIHPAPAGEAKVGAMLSSFFATDPGVQAWYAPRTGVQLVVLSAVADSYVDAALPAANFGADPDLRALGGNFPRRIYTRFDLSSLARPVRFAKLSLRVDAGFAGGGGPVAFIPSSAWGEATINAGNAPAFGATITTLPDLSSGGTLAAGVTAQVNTVTGTQLSLGLAMNVAGDRRYLSRETGQPPRLVLTVPVGCPADANADQLVNAADLSILLANFGSPVSGRSAGDFNADGRCNAADLSILLATFGSSC